MKAVVHEVFEHRLVLTPEATVRDASPMAVVDAALDRVEVPAVAATGE